MISVLDGRHMDEVSGPLSFLYPTHCGAANNNGLSLTC